MDLNSLSEQERTFLARASDVEVTRRRTRLVVLTAAVLAVLVVVAGTTWASRGLLVAFAVVYIVLTTVERVAYGNAVLVYKSLVQKLVAELDEERGEG